MTARWPIVFALAGSVLATVVVMELRAISILAAVLALFGYVGVGFAVAFLVGWPEVREGER